MSDFLQPYGLQPARLLCPLDSPSNSGVGCRFVLQGTFPGIKPSSHTSPVLATGFLMFFIIFFFNNQCAYIIPTLPIWNLSEMTEFCQVLFRTFIYKQIFYAIILLIATAFVVSLFARPEHFIFMNSLRYVTPTLK